MERRSRFDIFDCLAVWRGPIKVNTAEKLDTRIRYHAISSLYIIENSRNVVHTRPNAHNYSGPTLTIQTVQPWLQPKYPHRVTLPRNWLRAWILHFSLFSNMYELYNILIIIILMIAGFNLTVWSVTFFHNLKTTECTTHVLHYRFKNLMSLIEDLMHPIHTLVVLVVKTKKKS